MSRIIMRMKGASSTMRRRLPMCGLPPTDLVRDLYGLDSLDAVPLADDIGDADTEVFVNDHHFTLGDQLVVDQDVHGFAGQLVKFDDGPLRQLQDLLDLLVRPSEFDGDLQG